MPQWARRSSLVKSVLTTDEVASTDRHGRLIGGLDSYEQVGGVRRDLFDEEGGGYALNVALLDRRAIETLEDFATPYRSRLKMSGDGIQAPGLVFQLSARYPTKVELSAEDQAEYDAIAEDHDTSPN